MADRVFSDKVDRLYALIGLGASIALVSTGIFLLPGAQSFLLLALMFTIFGGVVESLYAVGVAHANDRAAAADYVSLSSTLLLVWALGGAIGPTVGALAMEYIAPSAFFVYAIVLAVAFTLFSVWRLRRRPEERSAETHEDFLAYPQTSPKYTRGCLTIRTTRLSLAEGLRQRTKTVDTMALARVERSKESHVGRW